ncbi:MAG: gas vesicle protein GvpO [Nitriliruptor sp.]
MSYDDKTNAELREELKERDLPVSGNKAELIERLEAADEEDGASEQAADEEDAGEGDEEQASDREQESSGGGGGSSGSGSGELKPMQLARLAGAQLMQLTGRDIDGTSGIERTDEGWRVLFEVVEVTRVPRAMDVLGLYEVIVDADGDLVRYERLRRFGRTQMEDAE